MRTHIVQCLAMWDSPTEVAESVQETFHVTVTRQHVESFNPDRPGRKPGKRWVALFRATREAFEKRQQAEAPSTIQAVRLRRLDHLERTAASRRDHRLQAALLRQIAEETGGRYTNRKTIELSPEDRETFGWVANLAALIGWPPETLARMMLEHGRPLMERLVLQTRLPELLGVPQDLVMAALETIYSETAPSPEPSYTDYRGVRR